MRIGNSTSLSGIYHLISSCLSRHVGSRHVTFLRPVNECRSEHCVCVLSARPDPRTSSPYPFRRPELRRGSRRWEPLAMPMLAKKDMSCAPRGPCPLGFTLHCAAPPHHMASSHPLPPCPSAHRVTRSGS
ncbi:hypothetical protein LX36DRAFT_194975 [Colletotrichum falcatum]|nr:hypothetical protein LX36DRAFT_194975 [Colletotrichum falcatum]